MLLESDAHILAWVRGAEILKLDRFSRSHCLGISNFLADQTEIILDNEQCMTGDSQATIRKEKCKQGRGNCLFQATMQESVPLAGAQPVHQVGGHAGGM